MSRINNQQKESWQKKQNTTKTARTVRSIQQKGVLTHSSKTARVHKNNKDG